MTALTPEATRCFAFLCELSLAFEVIDYETYHERLAYLDDLLAHPLECPDEDQSSSRDSGQTEVRGEEDCGPAHPEIVGRPTTGSGSVPPPDWVRFIPRGLPEWEFHKGDPDPLPSVPHGHYKGKALPKLDPYLGWVCGAQRKQLDRLPKEQTRALWNDAQYRDFASAALTHFIRENPRWSGWRVGNPLRLPRRR